MNDLIKKIFKDFQVNNVKIPISFLRYDGNSNTYITYMENYKEVELNADNELQYYVVYYDFDVYSKGNYLEVIKELKRILEENNFTWQPENDSSDMYEDDTKFYHKTVCFSYIIKEE